MKISCMEWNINGRGGAKGIEFPNFIADTIHSKNPDIVILVEFFKRGGWETFYKKLSKDYILCLSEDDESRKNQVLIAIKKELNPVIEQEVSSIPQGRQLPEDQKYLHPEFLQVDATIEKGGGERKPLSIIGTRIKTQGQNKDFCYRKKQFELLVNYIGGISRPFIVAGDFNNGILREKYEAENALKYNYHEMKRIIQENNSGCLIHTPTTGDSWQIFCDNDEIWSCGKNHNDPSKHERFAYDHFIVNCTCDSCEYDYSFVNTIEKEYNKANCDKNNNTKYPKYSKYLPKAGLPDHACLYGKFEL